MRSSPLQRASRHAGLSSRAIRLSPPKSRDEIIVPMTTILRALFALVGAVASFYFLFWLSGAILLMLLPGGHQPNQGPEIPHPWLFLCVPGLFSLVCAILVARFIWIRSGSISHG